jgi:hypothetical protein
MSTSDPKTWDIPGDNEMSGWGESKLKDEYDKARAKGQVGRWQAIKRFQKYHGFRHSRHSGNKKKPKKNKIRSIILIISEMIRNIHDGDQ